jgi:hypothetical protein
VIDPLVFAKGWAALATLFKPAPDDVAQELMYADLSAELSSEEFEAAVLACRRTRKSPFFPTTGDLVEMGRASGGKSLDAEVTAAFALVVRATYCNLVHFGKVTSCSCVAERWDVRAIEQAYGPAVAAAFLAAGGESAFRNMRDQDEPFVRKRFAESYTERVRVDRTAALPPAMIARALPRPPAAPQLTSGEITRAEAPGIMAKIIDRAERRGKKP